MDPNPNEGEKGDVDIGVEVMKGEQNERCSFDEVNFFYSVETNCVVLSVVLLSVENMSWVVADYFIF